MTKNLDNEGLKKIIKNYDIFYIDLWGDCGLIDIIFVVVQLLLGSWPDRGSGSCRCWRFPWSRSPSRVADCGRLPICGRSGRRACPCASGALLRPVRGRVSVGGVWSFLGSYSRLGCGGVGVRKYPTSFLTVLHYLLHRSCRCAGLHGVARRWWWWLPQSTHQFWSVGG